MEQFSPRYTISPLLLSTIKRITILVHELEKKSLPDVVVSQLQEEARTISTYASTSIEGNPLPLTEVKRLLKQRPGHIRQSEREVLNYNQVLSDLQEQEPQPLTIDLIKQIQAGIMNGLLPDHQLGRWRKDAVVVYDPRSDDIVYLPPNYQDVPDLMTSLVSFIQEKQTVYDPIILAGIFHKQMAVIHPFMDGNGRTARLATELLLAGLGLNIRFIFSFENYYNRDVTRYFQNVGLFGDYYELAPKVEFTSWLEYFAEGILDELLRVQKQIEQSAAAPDRHLESYHQLILDHIDQFGFIRDKDYAQLTQRAKATRTGDFNKMINLGLIVRLGKGRSTYYRRS